MSLPGQIRAVACVGWVSILGLGQYFAQSAGPSRLGVIRERVSGYAPDALGAQDAPARPRTGEPHTGEKPAAKVGSPGFAQHRLMPADTVLPESRVVGRWDAKPSDGGAQGVSSALARSSEQATLLRESGRGHYTPYEVTAYSHHCTVPIGPERPPQRMANGEWPIAGLHVAGPPEMRLGSVVEVVYRGLPSRLIVGDRGRAIRGRRLDLFLADCRAARAWGRRTAYVREVSE